MANLEYLLTLLPSLPENLGDKVSIEEAYNHLRFEGDSKLNYLVDVLSAEDEILKCGQHYFVMDDKSFNAELPQSLPEDFQEVFYSFKTKTESEWMTSVFAAWLKMLTETSRKVGSSLLGNWAKWEYSLRLNIMFDRMKKAGMEYDASDYVPEFLAYDDQFNTDYVIEAYKKCSEPMIAEKTIDQFRLDYLRNSAISYSFSADELIAYMLELRIYARYSRLDLVKGRKILQEVTAI
ncbi:MAG: DUF2764 family protein [Candidatus Riflebacteria bacterium]|nr:DUF2764 family protein [Candidatus Riflebacteria bacterium]